MDVGDAADSTTERNSQLEQRTSDYEKKKNYKKSALGWHVSGWLVAAVSFLVNVALAHCPQDSLYIFPDFVRTLFIFKIGLVLSLLLCHDILTNNNNHNFVSHFSHSYYIFFRSCLVPVSRFCSIPFT